MKILGAVWFFFLAGGVWDAKAFEPFQPQDIPGKGFKLMPESERSLQRMIIGLEPNSTKAYYVPGTLATSPKNKERVRLLRKQLFMIHFELVHGNLMRVLPSHTRLFVAIPDPEFVTESQANEAPFFNAYLKEHAGWTDELIKKRVSFFKVPLPLLFPQDMAEILGRDKEGRLVLGVGGDTPPVYEQASDELAETFPKDFKIHRFPNLNTEGGDTEVVWRPDGSIGLLIGQNRLRRYLEIEKRLELSGRMIPPDWIEDALDGFRKEFFGIPVLILGRKELENPGYISPEVFHIDMVANILRNGKRVMAFVPSYEKDPVDAYTSLPLGPIIVKRAQCFYDEAARELKESGYDVVRLPFRDHPIRNPVNVGKFTSPSTGRATIFLSKYPYHFPVGEEKRSMQADLQETLYAMDDAIELWRNKPGDEQWEALQKTLESVWKKFGQVEANPNPTFEAQAAIYRSHGIDVIPVVIYPSSEGGIHCLLLK